MFTEMVVLLVARSSRAVLLPGVVLIRTSLSCPFAMSSKKNPYDKNGTLVRHTEQTNPLCPV
jgi:hypothetical protein